MTKPTKQMVESIKADLVRDLGEVRRKIGAVLEKDPELDKAWAGVETFCAIAIRVIAKTNTSKIKDVAMTVEIGARMAGRPVISAE